MLLQHVLQSVLVGLILSSQHPASRDIDDDIAEELQREIDILRRQMKELTEKLKDSSLNNSQLENLQKDFDNLSDKMNDCNRKIDDLSKELQQEFKQKMEDVKKDMAEIDQRLSDRIQALEDKIEKMILDDTVGYIRTGQTIMAVQKYKSASYPRLKMPYIVKESYHNERENCQNIVNFLETLEAADFDVMVKAYGFTNLFSQIEDDTYNEVVSDCLFRLTYVLYETLKTVGLYDESAEYMRNLKKRMPAAVINFHDDEMALKRDKERCGNSQDYSCYRTIGEYCPWVVSTNDAHKGWYRLFCERYDVNMEGDNRDGGKVFWGDHRNDIPNQYWRPILSSNEKIVLQHNGTGKYLSVSPKGDCYEFGLSETRQSWWVLW